MKLHAHTRTSFIMSPTKQEIRRYIRQLKADTPADERARLSAEACDHLRQLPEWRTAQTVLLYAALPDEVATQALIAEAAAAGKRVLLPVVQGEELELRIYTGDENLREGAFHIAEPEGKAFTAFDEIELAVVPGVAFTHKGHRLGRGRGYYDRLLPQLTVALKVGLCWPFQLLDDLPHEPHDIMMDLVIC